MSTPPIDAIGAASAIDPLMQRLDTLAPAAPGGPTSFAQMMMDGIGQVDRKLAEAEAMSAAFAVDDSVPLHQVTYALEEARLSFELMLQVRARLVEAYQEIARMQL